MNWNSTRSSMNLQENQSFNFNKVFDSNTRRFESKLSKFLENAFVLTTCNATTAIMGIFAALGITDGEVITTPLSWAGTLSGPLLLNNTVRFAKLEEPTLTMDPKSIEEVITPQTRCVLTSDFLGMPVHLDQIRDICDKHHLMLIHDAATSFGSIYQGRFSGYYADVCIHSFGRNKAVTTGEGGCVSTRREDLFEKLLNCMAHPERQRFQLGKENLFAMNTTMHPFAVQYGLETFDSQMDKLCRHRDVVIERVQEISPEIAFSEDTLPNYYKPFFDISKYRELSEDWQDIPYESLSDSTPQPENYKVATDLCLH